MRVLFVEKVIDATGEFLDNNNQRIKLKRNTYRKMYKL